MPHRLAKIIEPVCRNFSNISVLSDLFALWIRSNRVRTILIFLALCIIAGVHKFSSRTEYCTRGRNKFPVKPRRHPLYEPGQNCCEIEKQQKGRSTSFSPRSVLLRWLQKVFTNRFIYCSQTANFYAFVGNVKVENCAERAQYESTI